jgi:tRNA pseudouridine55 synthase
VISGFLLLDKPEGWTTFDLIRDLRKKSGIKKIGHTGTLDPFATGLVILCIGKATRLSSLILAEDKEYLATIELGKMTESGDSTGNLIKSEELPNITEEIINESVAKTLKLTSQVPPQHSAVKINGKPAYKYARKGISLELEERAIKVYDFSIISMSDNFITYRTKVSKGTYVRSLTESFAEYMGTIAYTKELCRLSIGKIDLEEAVHPDSIDSSNWKDYLRSVSDVLSDYPTCYLNDKQSLLFTQGQKIFVENHIQEMEEVLVYQSSSPTPTFIGTASISNNILKPTRVLI